MPSQTSAVFSRLAFASLLSFLSASAAAQCSFGTSGGTLSFPELSPDSAGEIRSHPLGVIIDCPPGRQPDLRATVDGWVLGDASVPRSLRSGTRAIPYALRRSISPLGKGSRLLVLEGVIAPGALARATAGRYDDTFVICLEP